MNTNKNANTRFAIIGAGPAGLSVAHFLQQNGYSKFTIFEKNSSVGGKCISKTVDGKSFDIGANYVTSNYKIVRKLARNFKADLYTEGNVKSYDFENKKFRSVFKAVLSQSSLFKLTWHSLRYIWIRWRLNKIISPKRPGYRGISNHPDLCQPFEDWLKEKGLSDLILLFDVPITLMGYGKLTGIPTVYALTYLPVTTFCELVAASISTHILGYPKRFTEGFQRFFERLSWTLDTESIKLNTTVKRVIRGEHITIEYKTDLEDKSINGSMEFDYLFVAAPLYLDGLKSFMTDMNKMERKLFSQVFFDPFIITTYKMPGCEIFTAGCFVLPEPEIGKPFVVNRQFPDVDYITIYTRSQINKPVHKEAVLEANKDFIKQCLGLELTEPYTYNDFVYFPHVDTESMANGFYEELEELQGQSNTFYVGGLMNFELVEMIMNYSKHLIDMNFPKIPN